MPAPAFLTKATSTVVTGLVGVGAYKLLSKVATKAPLHTAMVAATELGLRGTRRAEEIAECARLKAADIVAEAKDRVGEESVPPATATPHCHDH